MNQRGLVASAVASVIAMGLVAPAHANKVLGYNLWDAAGVSSIALAGVAAEFGVVMLLYLKHALDERLARASYPAATWLFTRRILIPSNRRLLDWARDAFAKIEAQILICVADAVGRANAAKLLLSVHAPRPGTDVSRIEWLKTPPRRHSPTTLAETLEKVRYLKSPGVHEWDFSGVVLARQQAYARQIQARRPYRSRDIRIAAQLSKWCASCA